MVRENAELGLTADFSAALQRFADLYEQWRKTIVKIEGAAEGADLEALEREAESLAREMADVGRTSAAGLRQLEVGAEHGGDEIEELRRQIDRLEGELKNANSRIDDFSKRGVASFGGVKAAVLGIGTALAAIGAGRALRFVIETTAEFQKLRAVLETFEGGSDGAEDALQRILAIASQTPFEIEQITQAWTRLRAVGIAPTEELLVDLGNVAAGSSKDILSVTEAVNDAITGEFERLKEFGIIARSEGEQVSFTFAGVTTTVEKSATEILGYLQELSQSNFAGAMERQTATLGGAWSNLSDVASVLANRVGEAGLARDLQFAARALTGMVDETPKAVTALESVSRSLGGVIRFAIQIPRFYQLALASINSFTAGMVENAAKVPEALLGITSSILRTVKAAAEATPIFGRLVPTEALGRAIEQIDRIRERGVETQRAFAESLRETADANIEEYVRLTEQLEQLEEQLGGSASAAAAMQKAGEQGAEGVRALASAAAEALPPVKALADAAAEPLDFTTFGPGAEQAEKQVGTLTEQAQKLRDRIAELEDVPAKSIEQVNELFTATDQLAEVEGDLADAMAEAAPIIEGGTSLVEDHGAALKETVQRTQEWIREQAEAGQVSRDFAESAGALADEQERITLATGQAPAAFSDLATAIDTTGIAITDLEGKQVEQLKTTGDINASLEAMKERLDLAGAAQLELGKTSTETLGDQIDGYEKLTEEQKAQAEALVTLRKVYEEEGRKMKAALAGLETQWKTLNRLCDEHRECLTS